MVKQIKHLFRSHQGRHFFSRWFRSVFEKANPSRTLSFLLLISVFFVMVLGPQALAYVEIAQADNVEVDKAVSVETATPTAFQWPVKDFSFSQYFSWHHWGADLQAQEGIPVFPIAEGTVIDASTNFLGYGNFVVVAHKNGQQSLYAHLSKISVKKNEEITKDTVLGEIGHTGWATGPHLHLEIHENGLPLNPLEVLPER